MWLGERKLQRRGIGKRYISMLIMIGIISRFPGALIAEGVEKGSSGLLLLLIEPGVLFFCRR